MKCSDHLIEAWVDEELSAAQAAALEEHVLTCANCSRAHARLLKQKTGVKAAAPYYSAPSELRQSVRGAVERLTRQEAAPARVRQAPWRSVAIAATLLLFASLGWNVLQLRSRSGSDLAETVFADHIRSLAGPALVDVQSSDQHTVKPWFAGKLDFSPLVEDLQSQGFPLAGGRIDYLAGRRVAALVYHRRQHVISLFVWPGTAGLPGESSASRNGYNLLHWTDGSMTYWAVSDVSSTELRTFRSLFR